MHRCSCQRLHVDCNGHPVCADSLPNAKISPKTDKGSPEEGKPEPQQDELAKIFEAYDALILEQHKHRPVLEFDTFDVALDEFHGKVKLPLALSCSNPAQL